MTAQERLDKLTVQAKQLRREGKPVALEQLCRDCPTLLPELRQRLANEVGARTVEQTAEYSQVSSGGELLTGDTVATEPDAAGDDALGLGFLGPPQAEGELGRLGDYRILGRLGAGGMGLVFVAEDIQLGRHVALKVLSPSFARNSSARERFLREARLAAALEHDHVVPIYQVGQHNNVPFLAMQMLKGETLESRLRRHHHLPVTEVLRIGREVAAGLAAHGKGLIHRDIKPANLFLEGTRGRVKILDFGLARLTGDAQHLTQTGTVIGTPAYMAPEQARGESTDARSDLFSLGSVLYRMSTGRLPFQGSDVLSILTALATATPSPPVELDKSIPEPLSRLIVMLLAKDPAARPATAAQLATALARIALELSGRSSAPLPAPVPPVPPASAPAKAAAPAPPASAPRKIAPPPRPAPMAPAKPRHHDGARPAVPAHGRQVKDYAAIVLLIALPVGLLALLGIGGIVLLFAGAFGGADPDAPEVVDPVVVAPAHRPGAEPAPQPANPPSWPTYRDAAGGFELTMPELPTQKTASAIKTTKGDVTMDAIGYRDPQGAYYQVGYVKIATTDVEEALDMARDGAVGKDTLLKDWPFRTGPYTGRELTIEPVGGGSAVRAQFIVANQRIYRLLLTAPHLQLTSADANRFFNSFTIVP